MARFVFLSGSELSSTVWAQCCSLLEGLDHDAVAFDLAGLPPNLALASQALANRIGSSPDTVLVGHSVAGLFLPLIGERIGARCEIYIAALVPQPGVCFVEQMFEGRHEVFLPDWVACHRQKSPDASRNFQALLFHDCPEDSAMFLRPGFDATMLYEESFPLSVLPPRLRAYIVCTEDRTISPDWQREAAQRWLGVEPLELPSGHCPQLSRPHDLIQLLVSTVESQRIA